MFCLHEDRWMMISVNLLWSLKCSRRSDLNKKLKQCVVASLFSTSLTLSAHPKVQLKYIASILISTTCAVCIRHLRFMSSQTETWLCHGLTGDSYSGQQLYRSSRNIKFTLEDVDSHHPMFYKLLTTGTALKEGKKVKNHIRKSLKGYLEGHFLHLQRRMRTNQTSNTTVFYFHKELGHGGEKHKDFQQTHRSCSF